MGYDEAMNVVHFKEAIDVLGKVKPFLFSESIAKKLIAANVLLDQAYEEMKQDDAS